MMVPGSREEEINSALEVVKSRVLAERVVDALGTEAILDGRVDESTLAAAAVQPDGPAGPLEESRPGATTLVHLLQHSPANYPTSATGPFFS